MFSFDQSFINKLIKKEKEAFSIFYLQTVDHFFRYLKSTYTLSDQVIQDLLSSFYLKFRDVVTKYNTKYSFENYVWTVFKNLVKDYFKKEQELYFGDFSSFDEDEWESFEDTIVDPDTNMELLLQTTCNKDLFDDLMRCLDDESKDLLYWRFVEEKSYEEIAHLLAISVDNARQKISRLVRKLSRQLNAKR